MSADPAPPGPTSYRPHGQVAWTAHRHPLGAAPEELGRETPAVALVRLPDGWPLVLTGPPALVWQDLAASGRRGCGAEELATPWVEAAGAEGEILEDLAELLRSWERQGLIEVVLPL